MLSWQFFPLNLFCFSKCKNSSCRRGCKLFRCSTWLVKWRWVNRSLSHPASFESSCYRAPRMHWMTSVVVSPANLPTVFTGEISRDKQLLLHIISIVRRCWHFSCIFNQLKLNCKSIRTRVYYIMCAWIIFWIFSFCMHLFPMTHFL